ncbi:hypothetical protein Y1Q_0002475 [Alligator mississippiensis]|uniref:Uncharacterized protein n=1 Tax=Alligator mississippiensis TaxID=8496 RepID=A0A151NCE4_ALLMI|nr:hypothetical protein Y1Q_0002475 [Alligator mississippiensis]
MGALWFYEILNQSPSLYGLQSATMNNHKKIQETVRLRDTTSPMDLLPCNMCQVLWEHINHKDLCKDHKDCFGNFLMEKILPVEAPPGSQLPGTARSLL